MGSETEVQAPPAEAPAPEPAAPAAAASGGSKTGMILAIVVVMVVVVAALAYVFVLDDGDEGLSGQWTLTGGTFETIMVINNDTANTTWFNGSMPSSTEVIDFDSDNSSVGDMAFEDLGDGDFRITGFDMGDTDFGVIEGTYDIDGDTMTFSIDGASIIINDPMMGYMETEISMTYTMTRVV